ncbi:UNVERIFIED_CONTAM: hypothetical protein GTU68_021888, partial [Idotea baltica]|nr:hypothetical protein [Idotea baltica]
DAIVGYHSLTLVFKKEIVDFSAIQNKLQNIYKEADFTKKEQNFIWEIPVCYNKEFGIDLEEISQKLSLSIEQIVALHRKPLYTVFFIGFLPGFLYLGRLDKKLHFDRKPNPRLQVTKGTVAIGGKQTGIYPMESSGGWNCIGKTPISFFDVSKENPCFAKSGDKIKFTSISKTEFELISEKINAGDFKISKTLLNA